MSAGGNRNLKTRHNANMREYVFNKVVVRSKPPFGYFNPVLNAGRITQQLIVDCYCRIEE